MFLKTEVGLGCGCGIAFIDLQEQAVLSLPRQRSGADLLAPYLWVSSH